MKKVLQLMLLSTLVLTISGCGGVVDKVTNAWDKAVDGGDIEFYDGISLDGKLNAISIVKSDFDGEETDSNTFQSVNAGSDDTFETVLRTYNSNGVSKNVIVPDYYPVNIYTENGFSIVQYLNKYSTQYEEFVNDGEIQLYKSYEYKWSGDHESIYKTYLIDNVHGNMYSLEKFFDEYDYVSLFVQGDGVNIKNLHMKNRELYYFNDEEIVKIDLQENEDGNQELRISQYYDLKNKFKDTVNQFEDFAVDDAGRLMVSYSYSTTSSEKYGIMFSDPKNWEQTEFQLPSGELLPKVMVVDDDFYFFSKLDNQYALRKIIYTSDGVSNKVVWTDTHTNPEIDNMHKYSIYKVGRENAVMLDYYNNSFNYISIDVTDDGGLIYEQLNVEESIQDYVLGLDGSLYLTVDNEESQLKLSKLYRYDLNSGNSSRELITDNNLFLSISINDETKELYAIGEFSNNELIIKVYNSKNQIVQNDTLDLADKKSIIVTSVNVDDEEE